VGEGAPSELESPTPKSDASSRRTRATQTIPPATRRRVMARDHGRCVVPGCRCATYIDLHHLNPRAEGGQHDDDNLVVLCGAHHRAVHRGRLMKARAGGGESLHTGAVAFIQRFTKTLGIFPHVHVVFVDGVWFEAGDGRAEFRESARPDDEMVFEVGRRVFTRLERFLKREGYLDPTEGDAPEALDRWWMRATQEPQGTCSDCEAIGGVSL
jgi:hypothetical protein